MGPNRDEAEALAIQPDGKIVVVGQAFMSGNYDLAVARYLTDGNLDPTFGSGGRLITGTLGSDMGHAALVQPDGQIVVAGSTVQGSYYKFYLNRFSTNGGFNGAATTVIGPRDDIAWAVARQSNGKLVVAGVSNQTGTGDDFALVRYNNDLTLDTSFGTGGIVTTSVATYDTATAVAIQPDGKIVAAGTIEGSNNRDLGVIRYNANGSLDTSFGMGGKVRTDAGTPYDTLDGLVLQPDGKIVVAGSTLNDFVLARYLSDGSLDPSFGTGGLVVTSLDPSFDIAYAVTLQADGKIVAVGQTRTGGTNDNFGVARYLPNGALDPSFGNGGIAVIPVGTGFDVPYGVAVQADGRIVAAGTSGMGSSNTDFSIVRIESCSP